MIFLVGSALVVLSGIIYCLCKKIQTVNTRNVWHIKQLRKFQEYFELMDQWMTNREQGRTVGDYCKRNGYTKVAIYGNGVLGRHLCYELIKSGIHVAYIIDRRNDAPLDGVKVCKPDDELESVDAVFITVTVSYGSIAEQLEQKMDCSMISLEEIICES